MRRTETGLTIFLGCAAIACIVLAVGLENYGGVFMAITGIWLAVCALFLSIDQVVTRWIFHEDQRNNIMTRTEAVRKLEIIQRLSGAQLEALGGYVPMIEALGGSHGPLLSLRVLDEQTVALDFVYAFLELCNDHELLQIRAATNRLAKFSNARHQAELITNYFVYHGFARPAAGPNQAQWIDDGYKRACTWCGYGMVQIGWERQAGGIEYPANRIVIERNISSKHAEVTE